MSSTAVQETPADQGSGDDGARLAQYLSEVELYEREGAPWAERSKKIIRRYKDERNPSEAGQSRFNILWSSTQTMVPALYSQPPKPDVTRRYFGPDPTGRKASDILERGCSYFVKLDLFNQSVRQAVTDYALTGRGTAWVRYVPHMRDAQVTGPEEVADEGAQITDDADEADEDDGPPQEVYYEEALTDYVHWQDFGHNIARVWEEVTCVWRKVYLDRNELTERFGPVAATIPLDHKPENMSGAKVDNGVGKATIYELWDKSEQKAVWFHKDVPQFLDERPDPLKLEGFFPCPRPLLANLANDSLIPVPDYVQYQDQAQELDALTGRISMVTRSLKVAGIYDASAEGLARLLSEGVDNQLIPVDQFAMLGEKGGLRGVMDFLPIKEIADALMQMYAARDKVKADLYEITGLSDILRGTSDPNETATGVRNKTAFAMLRLTDKQNEVQRFVRDLVRLTGEIIAGHFSQETIKAISGVQLFTMQEKQAMQQGLMQPPPAIDQADLAVMIKDPSWEEVMGLLRDRAGLCFRIDIETNSTLKADQDAEKADRVEFLKAVGQFMAQATGAAQAHPEMAPLMGQLLRFGVRGFPVGKELEGAFDVAIDKMEQLAANPQAKPDPVAQKLQADQAMHQQQVTGDLQVQQARADADVRIEQAKAQATLQIARENAQMQAALERDKQAAQQQQFEMQTHAEMQKFQFQAQLEKETALAKAKIEADAKIMVAQIAAQQAQVQQAAGAADADFMKQIGASQVEALGAVGQGLQALASVTGKPKTVKRDPATGAVMGIE